MKLIDLNLVLYAIDESAPQHGRARAWLEEALSGTEEVGFAWAVLLGFVRLATSAAIFEAPLEADDALDIVESWLAQPVAVVVEPSGRHVENLRTLLAPLGTAGNLTTDAHLAALAIEHGAELCSRDADFLRFPDLRWVDPLA
ncbi:MAG TPA: type II toxin-antitoxin system VapC family toxin [Solirubrobacterales bacterium]